MATTTQLRAQLGAARRWHPDDDHSELERQLAIAVARRDAAVARASLDRLRDLYGVDALEDAVGGR